MIGSKIVNTASKAASAVMTKAANRRPDKNFKTSQLYVKKLLDIMDQDKLKDKRSEIDKVLNLMQKNHVEPRKLFQNNYVNPRDRDRIRKAIRLVDESYDDEFFQLDTNRCDCRLLDKLNELPRTPYTFLGRNMTDPEIGNMVRAQLDLEDNLSMKIESIANTYTKAEMASYAKCHEKLQAFWRTSLDKALCEDFKEMKRVGLGRGLGYIHYYLTSVDRDKLLSVLVNEVEDGMTRTRFSNSSQILHEALGRKVMCLYLKQYAKDEGSLNEVIKIYKEYLKEYCGNPVLMGQMNSRQYIESKAMATKNYAALRWLCATEAKWTTKALINVGKFLYSIIQREIKFDPKLMDHPDREIKPDNLIRAFYAAYIQTPSTVRVKEEIRCHRDFHKFSEKCGYIKLDYSQLPCNCPPMPWMSPYMGGFLTLEQDLVRFPFTYHEKHKLYDDFKTHPNKFLPTLDALTATGLCPWIVNKEILKLAIEIFRAGGNLKLSIPLHSSRMPNLPDIGPDASRADKFMHNKEERKLEQKKNEMYGLWCEYLYRLSIANHFKEKVFWFAQNLDFRGRTYPIQPHFNHIGADLARSLLLFAKGLPLGDKGLDWLKIHAINLTGTMKKNPLSERLDYANTILHSDIIDSADNPMDGRKWWMKHENPWQVLACCKDIAKAVRSKDHREYVSHLAVHQDGSCNGLQHYAALGRDLEGGLAVNLMPTDRPQDVYSRIVDLVESQRRTDAATAGFKYKDIAKQLEGVVDRKVVKQTVMTTVYGVTRYGAREQIARQLHAKDFNDKAVWQAAQYLASLTFTSIGQMFSRSQIIQDWFHDCAYTISTNIGKPVLWNTPLGFPVTQPYSKLSSPKTTDSSGKRVRLPGKDLVTMALSSKQRTAFPPNYVHSLDSSHMMLTALYCQNQGVTFASVHDCFWTHARTVDQMNRVCREQFVALHSQPLLEQLSEQFVRTYLADEQQFLADLKRTFGSSSPNIKIADQTHQHALKTFRKVPPKGELDLSAVLKSTYFFS